MKHVIHVNRSFISWNQKNPDKTLLPIYTIKTKGHKVARYAREVLVDGPSKMVYDGRQQNCGARAWIETDADIQLVDEMTYNEALEIKNGKLQTDR